MQTGKLPAAYGLSPSNTHILSWPAIWSPKPRTPKCCIDGYRQSFPRSFGFGLYGLLVIGTLVYWAIRYMQPAFVLPYWSAMLMKYMSSFLAHEARLSDPQRELTDHFAKQISKIGKAEKAPKKIKNRWQFWLQLFFVDTLQKHLWEV